MLLTHLEIQSKFAAKYAESFRRFPEFAEFARSPAPEWTAKTADGIQAFTRKELPQSFVAALCEWNLDKCEIAGFAFGWHGNYVQQILEFNRPTPGTRWWEDREVDQRPTNELMIAQGDPFVILLNEATGQILAYATDDGSFTASAVADNLSLFMRGLGTVSLIDLQDIGATVEALSAHLGANLSKAFWHEVLLNQRGA